MNAFLFWWGQWTPFASFVPTVSVFGGGEELRGVVGRSHMQLLLAPRNPVKSS